MSYVTWTTTTVANSATQFFRILNFPPLLPPPVLPPALIHCSTCFFFFRCPFHLISSDSVFSFFCSFISFWKCNQNRELSWKSQSICLIYINLYILCKIQIVCFYIMVIINWKNCLNFIWCYLQTQYSTSRGAAQTIRDMTSKYREKVAFAVLWRHTQISLRSETEKSQKMLLINMLACRLK